MLAACALLVISSRNGFAAGTEPAGDINADPTPCMAAAAASNDDGIVEACTAPDELMGTALEIARTIASKSPVSTRMGKHTLNVIEDMSLRDGYRYEQDMTAQIGKTEDAREAQLAFKEKRAPVFKGR